MSVKKEIFHRTMEKLHDAKDATKEKLGGFKDKLIGKNDASIERSKEIFDEGMDVTPEKLEEIAEAEEEEKLICLMSMYIGNFNYFLEKSYEKFYHSDIKRKNMSDNKGTFEKTMEIFNDVTKAKFEFDDKLLGRNEPSIERSKEYYDDGMDVTPEKLEEISNSDVKKFDNFRGIEVDEALQF